MKQEQESQIVESYKSLFDYPRRVDSSALYSNMVDGKCWMDGDNMATCLLTDEVTHFGPFELSRVQESEYVETAMVADREAYGFKSGEHTTWIDVKYLRKLANQVFDCSYDELKESAYVSPDGCEDYNGDKQPSPVVFKRDGYRAMVMPLYKD